MNFRVVLIDDEPLALEGLRRLCERSGVADVVGEALDGVAGVEMVEALQPDAVFLDIGMPGPDGLEVAAAFSRLPRKPLVVFVTAFDHFATEAFDLAVVDYVLKPIESARLDRALSRIGDLVAAGRKIAEPAAEFWVPSRGGMVRICASSINRVEAERDYVRFVVEGRTHLLRASLSAIAERLDPKMFVRVHRSTILRIDAITGLEHVGNGAWAALGTDAARTSIGRRHLATVRSVLGVTG